MRDQKAVKDALQAAADRAAVLGVREQRNPVQGVRSARGAAHPLREGRRRRPGAQAHRGRPEHGGAHPVGQGRRLRGAGGARQAGRHPHRHRQRERVPGRRLQARLGLQPRPAGPREGPRAPAGVRRRHGRDRVARPQAVVRRRHQLPRPGRHLGPPGPPRGGPPGGLRAAGGGPADAAGVQAVRAVVLHHRRARLGHQPAALPGPGRQGAGGGGHRPPRARGEHRVHRRPAAEGGKARRVRLQLPVLRR